MLEEVTGIRNSGEFPGNFDPSRWAWANSEHAHVDQSCRGPVEKMFLLIVLFAGGSWVDFLKSHSLNNFIKVYVRGSRKILKLTLTVVSTSLQW